MEEENEIFELSMDNLNPIFDMEMSIDENEELEEILDENLEITEDENPEEVGDQEDVDTDEEVDEEADSSSNIYSSFAAIVREQGLLPSLDIEEKEIKSLEDLIEAFKQSTELKVKETVEEQLNNLDLEKIANSKLTINTLETLDEDVFKQDVKKAKEVVFQDYLNQGLSKEKAERHLRRLLDLGEDILIEEAVESLENLKKFEQDKILEEKQNYELRKKQILKEQEELERTLKSKVYESKNLIEGFQPSKAVQDAVYKTITEVVSKSPDGVLENKFMKERRENPIDFETRMYYFYTLTNGFKDFSKIQTSAKSKTVSDFEKAAKEFTRLKDSGLPIYKQDSNSYDGSSKLELNL